MIAKPIGFANINFKAAPATEAAIFKPPKILEARKVVNRIAFIAKIYDLKMTCVAKFLIASPAASTPLFISARAVVAPLVTNAKESVEMRAIFAPTEKKIQAFLSEININLKELNGESKRKAATRAT